MDTLRVVEVKPVYGYGWLISGKRGEVPAAFKMKLERSGPKRWIGVVVSEGHEFEGRHVTLTQRHLDWSGYVDIVVEMDRTTSGSGKLVTFPSELR